LGTEQTVAEITLNDLKNYYTKSFAPQLTNVTIAGSISEDDAMDVFESLETKWKKISVTLPAPKEFKTSLNSACYFVDFPGARQSEIRIGNTGLAYTNPEFFKATVMNYKLGGSFNGIVNLILREEKGYTYGARTGFTGSEYPGYFIASSGVQSNATMESAEIFRDEIAKYRNGISPEDLTFTKNALIKSNALKFETIGALRGMLSQIAKYNLPYDFIKDQKNQISNMTIEEHKQLAQKYIHPDKMIYLIVGDKATQMEKLKGLGFGDPILLDKDGNKVN
jgi:zinc protease